MNKQKETSQNKINIVQAVANNAGKEGKILHDNRETTIQKKEIVIQKMQNNDEDDSIGARMRRKREFSKLTSRQQALYRKSNLGKRKDNETTDLEEPPKKKYKVSQKKKNIWDGSTRPGFTDETWETMLQSVKSKDRDDGVTVYKCSDGNYYPRKRDRKLKEKYVTLDHKRDWKRYLHDNAEPDEQGEITKAAAKIAYNDTSNLKLMSNSDNSSKNGPKNQFD
ncbi:hypothetical protein [Flavobacterium sp. J27]|uniref:hypothetical protein n=1 Tax=Flavobacterium sp. J27 TaxID=2060419 RepID=UPI0010310DC7|nr:hypothetical protein [Flavobacterium sp. J27]